MARIIHRKDPSGITNAVVYNVPNGTNVLEWVSDTFKDQSELCGDLACSFVLNKKVIFSNDDEDADESALDFVLGDLDDLVIVNRPAFTGTIIMVVLTVVAVAVAVLTYMALKDLPGAEDAPSTSPNNLLNAASNEFRPRQGIPECLGYGVAYPDFIQPSYYYYDDNLKIQVGLFCISVGEVDVPVVRVGETPIDNIPRSNATVYLPGQIPPDQYLTIHQTASTVDGQVAIAPNDDSVVRSGVSVTLNGNGTTTTAALSASIVDDIALATGGFFYIRSSALNGVFEITSITGNGSAQTVTFGSAYSGSAVVSSTVGRGYKDGVIGSGTSGELDYWIGWFDLPGDDVESVWCNWQAPKGIRANGGGTITISLFMEIESLDSNDDPTGSVWSQTVSVTANTYDAQFRTSIFGPDAFPGMTRTGYRWRCRRTTGVIDFDGSASEEIKIELIESVTPYSNPNFGDVTTLLVERKATLFSADQSGKKINVDYRRKLPTYNRLTGEYDQSTLTATDGFADAAAYTLIAEGKEAVTGVDLDEVYAIYDGLSDSRLGGFSFTFDDADLSMGERIESICNTSRVVGYHDGKQWRFTREEAKPVRSAMFNRRVVVGNRAMQAWAPQRDDDSDSVRIIYVDPDSNSEKYIERKFDLLTGDIISGDAGNVVKEITLAGCRSEYQAINRAELEIRRLAYQRRTVTETTLRDALELELLDRIDWVDINDVDIFDGEILGINGSDYDTSERFEPVDGQSYVVYVTGDEGYPSNTVECLPRLDTEFGFTAIGLNGAYLADGDEQLSSRYLIANASDLIASEFTLKSRTPQSNGNIEIELIEYRSEMFEMDETAAPDSAPIIASGLIASNVAQTGNTSTATLTLNDDGAMTVGENTVLWYSGGATANVGDAFEAFVTVTGGSSPTGTIGAWVNIGTEPSWSVVRSADGVTESVINLMIRQIEYNDNSAENDISIQAVVAVPVSLPSSIDSISAVNNNFASARVDFESNGEWSAENDSGNYTTVSDRVGEKYEIMASNLVGTAPTGFEFDMWHTLDGSGAEWILSTSAGALSTFDVEVREIANVANADSTSITMYASITDTVQLPAAISTDDDEVIGTATASIRFESSCDWVTNDGEYGKFASIVNPSGARYEIRASGLSGDSPSGPSFNVWHTITEADIEWELSTTGSADADFTVEIREIYNPANIASTAVSMSASVVI